MAELVVLGVAALLALLWREHLIAKERQAWIDERHMLLERIQRPERLPAMPRDEAMTPAERKKHIEEMQRVRREMASIGTVAPPRND